MTSRTSIREQVNSCPRCRQPMLAFELDGIEIDHCATCLGTWLDTFELEWIAERAGVELTREFSAALARARTGSKTEKRCPRCRGRLRTASLEGQGGGAGSAIEIDSCARHCGMWLDQGELRGMIEQLHDGTGGAVADFFRELYRSELEPDPVPGKD